MAMTDTMDSVDYATVDFNNLDDFTYGMPSNRGAPSSVGDGQQTGILLRGHPLWLTEAHFVYHLYRDEDGVLGLVRDRFGQLLTSPRPLRDLCQYELVHRPSFLESLRLNSLPSDLYPRLMTEAILQSQLRSVAFLISTWPFYYLHVKSLIPLEESISRDYLTAPIEGNDCMSLLDAMAIGLLSLKPHAKLQHIDFTGFPDDRRLCRELLRLPIVWMKPRDRQAGFLHSLLRKSLVVSVPIVKSKYVVSYNDIMASQASQDLLGTSKTYFVIAVSKDKMLRYIHKISCIYHNTDLQVRHGHSIGPITIILDCQMTVDDVLIGLALQDHTPFRYVCQRAWYEFLPEVGLPLHLLTKIIPSRHLTHLQIEDREVCSGEGRWANLLEGLLLLPALRGLALPNTIHVTQMPEAVSQLCGALSSLVLLQRLSLSSCTLHDSLSDLLTPMTSFPLTYLNIRDARLAPSDLQHLIHWHGLVHLRELNLSHNNLGSTSLPVASLLPRMPHITCFAVSFCSLDDDAIRLVVRRSMDCVSLKVLCVQSFIPPPLYEIRGILEDCAQIPSLQKCVLLPEAYAFPGSHISQRADNHNKIVLLCGEILMRIGRPDIQLE